MTDNTKPSIWSSASLEGLILSTITVIFSTLSLLVENSLAGTVFWILRTFGSVYILIYFIRRYLTAVPLQNPFSYGTAVCLFSSVICAAWTFVCYRFLFPSKVTELFDTLDTSLAGMNIPSESMDILYTMQDKFALISFFSVFIGAFLFGLIASAIIGGSLNRRKDIFAPGQKEGPAGSTGRTNSEDDDDII